MVNDLTMKRTSLSTTTDVKSTLDWKLETLREEEKDVISGIADYIALSLAEIEAQEQNIKQLKADITERTKWLKLQADNIKEGSAKFLEENGIDKLEGNICSSITIVKGKAKTKTEFHTELSKKDIEKFLVDSGMGYYKEVEVEAPADKIRVNRRKIALTEVVEREED